MRRLQVIVFPVGERPRVEEIDGANDGLAAMQKLVGGGLIERVPYVYWNRPVGSKLELFCNENGVAEGLKPQVRPEIGQRAALFGDLVLARVDEEKDGETQSVTAADVALFVTGRPS